MRNFEVRIWDIVEKSFTYSPTGRFLLSLDGKLFDGKGFILNSDRYKIDVCSGVPDKFHSKIYENDILRYTHPSGTMDTGYVSFFAGAFRCNWSDQTDDDIGLLMTESIRIIGNRHVR